MSETWKRSGKRVRLRGLGDAVAVVAQPIAKAIDRVAGTDLANCKGCDGRQSALNQAVPFKRDG